jgi:hypothetical protein
MANRFFENRRYSMEKAVVDLWANVSIGATGAPTLNTAKGIASISRSSAGVYVFTLQDSYQRLLNMNVTFFANGAAAAAPDVNQSVADTVNTTKTITIRCNNNSGTATDPASGEVMFAQFTLSNSTAV